MTAPKAPSLRPTSDRLRENIFNLLSQRCTIDKVLDLYAGVGTLGLEAISRGATSVTCVERSVESIRFMRRNSAFCYDQVTIMPVPVIPALKALSKKGERFDLCFIDPPYDENLVMPTLTLLSQQDILKEGFVILVQHSKREVLTALPVGFFLCDQRKYGDSILSIITGCDS